MSLNDKINTHKKERHEGKQLLWHEAIERAMKALDQNKAITWRNNSKGRMFPYWIHFNYNSF